jgi:O-methyltransferase involved in polyketide biosynthesis
VHWFDLNVPEITNLWRRFSNKSRRRRFLATSAFDTAWMHDVQDAVNRPGLFFLETSTLYFSGAENRNPFSDLTRRFPNREVFFDREKRNSSTRSSNTMRFGTSPRAFRGLSTIQPTSKPRV